MNLSYQIKINIREFISFLFYYYKQVFTHGKSGIHILMYHSITMKEIKDCEEMTVPVELFEKHMAFLKAHHFNIISLYDAASYLRGVGDIPENTVTIVFDDGYHDNYKNALPILERYGIPATFFLVEKFLCDLEKNFLSLEEVEKFNNNLFSFGSHTLTHPKVTFLDNERKYIEICESKKILQKKIGRAIDFFAYPFGAYGAFNRETKEYVQKAKYTAAVTTIHGNNYSLDDCFELKRIRISWHDNLVKFKRKLQGSHDWYGIYQKASFFASRLWCAT